MTAETRTIEIEPATGWVRVLWGAQEVASSGRAQVVHEAGHKPVIYVPREDAKMDMFERTARTSHCPRKGDANYFTLAQDGRRDENAVWTYENPLPQARAIAGHLAFYPDRVVILVEPPAEDVAPEPPE